MTSGIPNPIGPDGRRMSRPMTDAEVAQALGCEVDELEDDDDGSGAGE